jgi:hypothetical protein
MEFFKLGNYGKIIKMIKQKLGLFKGIWGNTSFKAGDFNLNY